MVAIAGAIISQRSGHFDLSAYRDRYQEALQQLIEAKTKGLTIKPRAVSNALAGHRFDGRPETQPRAGTIRAGARNGKKEAKQASIRSTAAGFAPTRNRRSQEKSTALGRLGCQQD